MSEIINVNVTKIEEIVTINATPNVTQIIVTTSNGNIPTKTSDLTNDGEDGINPFITLEDVPSVEPLGLIRIEDIYSGGELFTDLATGIAYLENYTNATITDASFNEGVLFFTVPRNSSFDLTDAFFSGTSANFYDELGLISTFGNYAFGGIAGIIVLGDVTFGTDCITGGGYIEIGNIYGFGTNFANKFTTALKSSYDGAVSWITTNGSNLINHLTNYSNPHQTTAAQVGAYTSSETDTLLNDKVPYTGATTNVDLGEYQLKAGQIEFDQTPTGTFSTGMVRWNDVDGTTERKLKGGNVTLQDGQEIVKRVVNKTGVNLLESSYKVVRIRTQAEGGSQGQRSAIVLAQANTSINSNATLGVVTENITNNQEGFITLLGEVREINTTGSLQSESWVDGDQLYLSPTVSGGLTKVVPATPYYSIPVATIDYAHAIHGKISVNVGNRLALDTTLAGDNDTAPSVTAVRTYAENTANKVTTFTANETSTTKFPVVKAIIDYFTSSQLATILGFTPANDADVVHLDGTETITGFKTFQGATQTGSSNVGILSFLQTWNTTGLVKALILNITDTASNGSSLLIDLQRNAVSVFNVTKTGATYTNTSFTAGGGAVITTSGFSKAGTFQLNGASGSYAGFSDTQAVNGNSGNWVYNSFNISPIINQTGTPTGITRGFYVNPTLTNVIDFRAIEVTKGSIVLPYQGASTTYPIKTSDYLVDFTTGTFTATLPTSVGCVGKTYVLKNSGSGVITIATTSSQTIDGVTTNTLIQYASITVVSNGANWIKI